MTWTLKRNDANEVIKKQRQTHSLRERIYGCRGEKMGGMDSYGVWDRYVHTAIFKMENMYNIMYETSCQSRFDARYWMLGAGALGRPRGRVWGGRREEGSGWGTRVYLWRIHFDVWQN